MRVEIFRVVGCRVFDVEGYERTRSMEALVSRSPGYHVVVWAVETVVCLDSAITLLGPFETAEQAEWIALEQFDP